MRIIIKDIGKKQIKERFLQYKYAKNIQLYR